MTIDHENEKTEKEAGVKCSLFYILEYPNGDSVSRKMIRNRLKTKLPFALQENVGEERKLIHKVEVLSIEKWNASEEYGKFPILEVL